MKTLIALSFVVDVEDFDELSDLIRSMEDSAGSAFREALTRNATTFEELSEIFEYYGISATPMRDTVDRPA